MRGQKPDVEELLRQSQTELLWIQRQLSIIAARNASHIRAREKLKLEVLPPHLCTASAHNVNRFRLLEERNRDRKIEVATQKQQKQHYRSLVAWLLAVTDGVESQPVVMNDLLSLEEVLRSCC
ncbi:hypothetical protein P4O66_016823 [Electrophorus voltai]|uniref:Uncharacterized protein n=1 Tax=Electrophorus voltai TaxID=2609070 RepID=A0AAD8YWP9_9TELE|nr:hypothetical protein P4O66_016823 [Electrophorus voltai]